MSQTSPWSQDDRSPPVYARDNQNIPILILEAILLSTFVPGENNIPDKGFTRPLYVSPTALSSGFLNSSTENLYQVTDGDVLVNFAGTLSSFSVVFRVVGLRPEKQIRLSIHETVRSAKSSDPILTHHSVEFMGSHYPSNSVVKIYSTHPAPVFQSCTKENSSEINGPVVKLIQIFDQSRRLLFSQEWLLEIGTLNEDAISWLRDLHCSLDPWLEDLSQPSMIFNHLQNNFAGSAAKSPKTDSYNVQNHSALSFNEDKKFEFSGESSIEELTDDEKFVSDDSKSLKMIHSGSASTIRSHSSFLEIIKENDCKSDHQFFSRSSSISEILNETNSGILDEFEISNSSKDIETNQTPKTVVDMFHQLGFWLYGTRVGQLLTRNQRSSVNKSSIKTFYSLETIWLLGHKFLNDRSDTPLIVNMLPIEKLVVSPNNLHALRLHPHLHNQFKISTGDFFFSEILLLPLTLSKHMQHLRSLLVDGCKWSPISDDSESDHLLHLNLSEIKSETCISAQSPSSIAKITLQTWTRTIAGSNKILAYLVVQSKPQEQEKARAVFIDFLNEIMALCAGERAAIQFVFKQALNCKVEVGPHPRSLIHVNKNICKPGSITNNMNYSVSSIEEKPYKDEAKVTKGLIVLLWSEHISDWIERAFSIKFRTRNPKRPVLTIQSTVHPLIGLVEIDLLASTVFFFSDATLRFAVSFSSNTWLCLRATSIEDFTALLTYVPFLMRTLDENFSSESLPKSLSKKIISESTIEIMTLSPRNFSSSMESLDGLLPQKTPLMPHLQNSPTLESPLHRESDENIILKSEEKEDVVVGGFREFESAFYRCFWFTYRRDMPRLSPSILTSDAGFGCMIRAGQSMMAEAAAIVTFGTRHWRLDQVYNDPIASLKYRSVSLIFDMKF